YIYQRNIHGVNNGKIVNLIKNKSNHFNLPTPLNNTHWLQCQLNSQEIIFPIQPSCFMQKWSLTAPTWYIKKIINISNPQQ
ncbi:hypothetical protein, partial [Piscirickettsia litoralis]|uniref:hypothetical protein n=1 Tax=Piscirickettsia litoralis TaxID=1891921 RepID=UPI001F2E4539